MTSRLRQDAVIRLLRRAGTATVDAVAAELEVSRRTVLRDISALRDQGFAIHSEPGPGGGLQLDPQSVQATARLSVVEVFALLVSVSAMGAARALPFSNLADSGLAKIEKCLPPDKVRDLRRLLACLHVGQLSPHQDISNLGVMDPDLLPIFETAFLNCVSLRFQYSDAQGRETRRQIEPQALLILPPLWYLVAWDPERGGFRHFRMDRIIMPELVEGAYFRRRAVPFEDDICPFRDLPR